MGKLFQTFWLLVATTFFPPSLVSGILDPKGQIHIPIGIADTVDSLKTFVEAEGNFSPGFCSYGVYFWVYDPEKKEFASPTMDHIVTTRGLAHRGYLIPWTSWEAFGIKIKTEVCEVIRKDDKNLDHFITASRVFLNNPHRTSRRIFLYAAVRPIGAAGGPIKSLSVSENGQALVVDGNTALVSNEKPSAAGVLDRDELGAYAVQGTIPLEKEVVSEDGTCSGFMRFDLELSAGQTRALGFLCPVLAGRQAVRHQWDGISTWAQLDLAQPNPPRGGIPQPDPGVEYFEKIRAHTLFDEAREYWKDLVGRSTLKLPDSRWVESFTAIAGHSSLCMNEGAPDVAVVNYNVFNRDGVYLANILQKSGRFDLAAKAIDYFISHPFNGRVQPEADNPGQILWIMGEHWRFTRDPQWVRKVYPAVQKLVRMIEYYRTTPGPHWVNANSLDFGHAIPPSQRQELKPGSCDGFHPEYTEAFDIAGLRAAVLLAEAARGKEVTAWRALANRLFQVYDEKFGAILSKGYGSYSVLWPCRLYPLDEGKGLEQFNGIREQKPGTWRYFPLATAHQGLLAGNRNAGHKTLDIHLAHEQMKGWYAFDEGGKSGSGGWKHALTTWNGDVAMPHGWAIAEFYLLLRDCLLFEDGERLVLMAGVPPEWLFRPGTGAESVRVQEQRNLTIENFPTHFGACSYQWIPKRVTLHPNEDGTITQRGQPGATLVISGSVNPPLGFILKLPAPLKPAVFINEKEIFPQENGDYVLPSNARKVNVDFK